MIVVSVSSFSRPLLFFFHMKLCCVRYVTFPHQRGAQLPHRTHHQHYFVLHFFFAFPTSTHKTGEKEKNVTNKTAELLKRAERKKNEVKHSR